ncbi:MAG: sulfatase [Saprospiraceae bacterium]|nr:sulfatase [Saprospiraceae bacterium]
MNKEILLSAIILLMAACTSVNPPSIHQQPNIIVIFTDDLGYGDLTSYGHPTIRTHHLDQMAREGLRFTSFYAAASVCTPSRGALLTGRYPIRHTPYNFGPESTNGLPLSEITLADLVKEQGYATMAVGKWHLGHQPDFLPTERGFDHFYGLPYSNDMILPWCPWLSDTDTLFLYENAQPTKEIGFNQETLTEDYTRKAVEFISTHTDQPFFLYLAHSMPHLPVSTSERFQGTSQAGLYGDVIETLDWSTGEILKALKEHKLDEHTIVVFTSDNGPWQNLPDRMLQRDIEPWHSGSTGPLRGAKATTYEGGFRFPCVIRWPGTLPADRVIPNTLHTMDLFTTLSLLAGAEPPADRPIDGRDIWPILSGESQHLSDDPFFYLWLENLHAVRKGEWKLRITEAEGTQLFHLGQDPSEKFNLADSYPNTVDSLQKLMIHFADSTEALLYQ